MKSLKIITAVKDMSQNGNNVFEYDTFNGLKQSFYRRQSQSGYCAFEVALCVKEYIGWRS